MDWQDGLISLYLFVCKAYETKLSHYANRRSNNSKLCFTDEEVITIQLFGIMRKRRTLKEIYAYAKELFSDWFPHLPKYAAFCYRVKKLSSLFQELANLVQTSALKELSINGAKVIDSMPIVWARGSRAYSKKPGEIVETNIGYCATKKMHYYGLKLHLLGKSRKKQLPVPLLLKISSASIHDRKVYELMHQDIPSGELYADKGYQVNNEADRQEEHVRLLTPVKKAKAQKHLCAADSLFSKAICSIRQPVESFFNWLEDKTSIQMASKVRSPIALLSHIFSRLSAAMLLFFFPPLFNF